MDLARHLAISGSTSDQWEPAFQPAVVFLQIDSEAHVAQERLLVATVVNGNIDLGLVTEYITRGC
jgi:hypothetical protein